MTSVGILDKDFYFVLTWRLKSESLVSVTVWDSVFLSILDK